MVCPRMLRPRPCPRRQKRNLAGKNQVHRTAASFGRQALARPLPPRPLPPRPPPPGSRCRTGARLCRQRLQRGPPPLALRKLRLSAQRPPLPTTRSRCRGARCSRHSNISTSSRRGPQHLHLDPTPKPPRSHRLPLTSSLPTPAAAATSQRAALALPGGRPAWWASLLSADGCSSCSRAAKSAFTAWRSPRRGCCALPPAPHHPPPACRVHTAC